MVDGHFQIKYTMLVVFVSSIIFAILGYKLYQMNVTNTEILQIQSSEISAMVADYDRGTLYILAGFFLLQVGSLFVLGILITHRIAGPMFRVSRTLEEIAETGEVRSLQKVRSKDEFKGFFGSLGHMLEVLEEKRTAAQASLDRLESLAKENGSEEIKAEIQKLKQSI